MKCPLGSVTPLNRRRPVGKLAAVVQEVPPFFFKISVEAVKETVVVLLVPNPPVTIKN